VKVGVKYEERIRELQCRVEEQMVFAEELAALLENSAGVGVRRQDRPGQRHGRRISVDRKAPRIRTTGIRLVRLSTKRRA